jgi:3-deoxy-manno-octulosonate cytidylyltransferase (CMP-KDO synthetase)
VSTLIVIPARLGATRLPNKPLRDLAGKPLIVRVFERVRALGIGDRVVVATDAEAVADAVRAAGGEAVLTQAGHASGTDRVAEAACLPAYRKFELVVNVQGDEPFIGQGAIRAALEPVRAGTFAIGTAACPDDPRILDEPSVVKVVVGAGGRALYFSRAAIPHLRDPGDHALLRGEVLRHIGVYACTRDALMRWVKLPPAALETLERLEQLRPLAAGLGIGVGITYDAGHRGIDTEDDLRRGNAVWPALGDASHAPPPVTAGTS